MKVVQKLFLCAYILIVVVFFISAITLVIFALGEIWGAIRPAEEVTMRTRFVAVLECIGLLTIAVAALELGQTILEEEVQRSASISAPTRVRRFLSRFIVVVVVALSIECLVAVFEFIHDAPQLLPHAASVGVAAATLLAAWGVFVRLNIAAETLEPEAMKDAKDEDEKVEAGKVEVDDAGKVEFVDAGKVDVGKANEDRVDKAGKVEVVKAPEVEAGKAPEAGTGSR